MKMETKLNQIKGILFGLTMTFNCNTAFAANGDIVWTHATTASVDTLAAIDIDGTLYISGFEGLVAVNPDGTLKWHYPTNGRTLSSPTIGADGTIYITDADVSSITLPAPAEYDCTINNKLYAVYPDGSLKWSLEIANYNYEQCQNLYLDGHHNIVPSTPAVSDKGTIYVLSNGFSAVNSDGTLKWHISEGVNSTPNPPQTIAIAADTTIYFVTDKTLHAIDKNGALQWNFEAPQQLSIPIIGDNGTIYIGSGEKQNSQLIHSDTDLFYAINSDGSQLWAYESGSSDYSPTLDVNGNIYVGTNDGDFYSLRSNGQRRWTYKDDTADTSIKSSIVTQLGSIILATTTGLRVLDDRGRLQWSNAIVGEASISDNGTIYQLSGSTLNAILSDAGTLADSPWPKIGQNIRNNGRIDDTDTDGDGVVDYLDHDDDNDGIPDVEDPDSLNNGESDEDSDGETDGEESGSGSLGFLLAVIALLTAIRFIRTKKCN